MNNELFHIRTPESRDLDSIQALVTSEGMFVPKTWEQGHVAVNADDEVVGYIHIQQTAVGPHVAPVAVHELWRGHGVGRALVDFELERNGSLKLVSNGPAVPFYRALGFTEIGFDEISDDLEEDCSVCEYRQECNPVPFVKTWE